MDPRNDPKNRPQDPIVAAENAKRASEQDAKSGAEIRRIEQEAAQGTTAARAKRAAEVTAEDVGGNLTEIAIRQHMEGDFVTRLGMDPDKARELAKLRAAQMVGKDT